ncbi:MAG TPA: lysophospholipid acyltransferase family protein [Caulobacteraceae bacterium]|jgi:1-acyl-sn-glycerol-3-phosphate acyltransferase|nr:lysophospholipid acyltransferase family protein [Caulobacteraceae bacterium]
MRSLLFAVAYWVMSIFYALVTAIMAMLPGRAPMAWALRLYTRRMLWAMRWIAGIRVDLRGQERLPEGAFIIAAKHHSWGDGFVMFANVPNLVFVTGDHLESIPLLRGILRKFGAIVVDNCGGPEARKALSERAAAAHADGQRILIYPEGNLAKAGERFRYRTGVFYMSRDFNLPVVPVATNLGLFWPQQAFEKHPGTATVEFLDPIAPGLERSEFLRRLEDVVETRTQQLIAMATGEPVRPSVLVPAPDEIERAKKAAAVAEAG